MADTMRLTYSGTNIDFAPGPAYAKPDVLKITHRRAGDGTLHTHKFYYKLRWEVPITWLNKTDTDNLNSWWSNARDCTLVPDLVGAPGTSYTVRIVNTTRPILRFIGPYWETYFQGTLILEQT